MDDLLVQCNKNSVYVLNSSYRYRDFDMIELFGSPAGRALTVNNRTAAEMHPCSKSNSSSNIANSTAGPAPTQNHPLCQQPLYHPLQNCGFSGTCSTISANHSSHSTTASNKFVDSSDLIRYRNIHPHPHHPVTTHLPTTTTTNSHGSSSSSRTNSKMAKIWKLFDEDRIQNKGSTNVSTTGSSCTSTSGSEFFSRCQSRRKSNTVVHSEEKSTKDLYNEAAQLLGIRCTLSDSCRCIDCQSQYFDCDDFDSYSEYSDRSYDPEDNFIVNQSYFMSNDTGHHHHQDLSEVHCQQQQQQQHQEQQDNSVDINEGQKDDEFENEDGNGNKNDQYSHHGVISGPVLEDCVRGMRRRKCNESEIGSESQQISRVDSSTISARDYAVANGINELEVNSNLVA